VGGARRPRGRDGPVPGLRRLGAAAGHDEGGRLELARRLYAKGDAALAVEALAPFSTSGSGSANVDEAVYLLGLCHLK
jgi:outer membrane protein assembly factor BamD (BamD/ComL family)